MYGEWMRNKRKSIPKKELVEIEKSLFVAVLEGERVVGVSERTQCRSGT